MGFYGAVNRLLGSSGRDIADANAPTAGLQHEWLYGRFSTVVVGESHRLEAFMRAYSDSMNASGRPSDGKWGRSNEFVDKVAVELRRDPTNSFDRNAIQVWVLTSGANTPPWHGGFVDRNAARFIAPVVDRAGITSWRHPALVAGDARPSFGIILQPTRLLTRGPDLTPVHKRGNWWYPSPTDYAVGYFIRSLEGLSSADRTTALALFALNGADWRDKSEIRRRWDQRQLSLALDTLNGVTLDSPWRQ